MSDLPQAVRIQILRKTEGNPFFIEEVVRALIAEGTLVKDAREGPGAWPSLSLPWPFPTTIQGVIVARIDRLEEGVKNVLKLASVIGRSFFLRNPSGDLPRPATAWTASLASSSTPS